MQFIICTVETVDVDIDWIKPERLQAIKIRQKFTWISFQQQKIIQFSEIIWKKKPTTMAGCETYLNNATRFV